MVGYEQTLEAEVTSRERSRYLTHDFWVPRITGLALVIGLSAWAGYSLGEHSHEKEVARAEEVAAHNKHVLLTLIHAGITNIDDVYTDDNGTSRATLSQDPHNPEACKRDLFVSADATSLGLTQTDAGGREYAHYSVANAADQQAVMTELCNQKP